MQPPTGQELAPPGTDTCGPQQLDACDSASDKPQPQPSSLRSAPPAAAQGLAAAAETHREASGSQQHLPVDLSEIAAESSRALAAAQRLRGTSGVPPPAAVEAEQQLAEIHRMLAEAAAAAAARAAVSQQELGGAGCGAQQGRSPAEKGKAKGAGPAKPGSGKPPLYRSSKKKKK